MTQDDTQERANSLGDGLYRNAKGGTIHVRRRVPSDLVGKPRPQGANGAVYGALIARTTRTRDPTKAGQVRERIWAEWDREFATARGRKLAGVAIETVKAAILAWEREQVAEAAGIDPGGVIGESGAGRAASPFDGIRARLAAGRRARGEIALDVVEAARAYFRDRRDVSQGVGQPVDVTLKLSRLDAALSDPSRWRDVPDAEREFAGVLARVESPVGADVQAEVLPAFLQAFRVVVQHAEAERLRSAAILATVNVLALQPTDVRAVLQSGTTFTPRLNDKTVKQVVEEYEAHIKGKHGDEVNARRYAHMYRAARQVLGDTTYFRSIGYEETERLRDIIRDAPSSATKRFPGMPLADTIAATEAWNDEQEDEDDCYEPPAPATVTAYVKHLSGMWEWAKQRRYADDNPMQGLEIGNAPNTKRRGFTSRELQAIFDALNTERDANSWRFWVPAIAAFNGARMGEIIQLKTTDFREDNGRHYFELSEFDHRGRRDKEKRSKTDGSDRKLVPHLDLIDAGLVEFVQSLPAGRVFPGVTSRDTSRWFAKLLTTLDLKVPATCFHSLRHGFRTYCDKSKIDPSYRRALGGWVALDVAEDYGDRHDVEVLAREIDRLRLGDFTLKAVA